MPEFPCSGPIVATVRTSSGHVHVVAEPRSTVAVDVTPGSAGESARVAAANTRVEFHGDDLLIEVPQARGFVIRRSPRVLIAVRVPPDSQLRMRSASADVTCAGRYGTSSINTASGDVRIEHIAGDLECHTASGGTSIERIDGDATVTHASGDIRLGVVGGNVTSKSASGDIAIDAVAGSARVSTASGDIRLHHVRTGTMKINAASGDVLVGVAEGTAVWLDLDSASGTTRSELPVSDAPPSGPAPELNLRVRTASGDITVLRSTIEPHPPAPPQEATTAPTSPAGPTGR